MNTTFKSAIQPLLTSAQQIQSISGLPGGALAWLSQILIETGLGEHAQKETRPHNTWIIVAEDSNRAEARYRELLFFSRNNHHAPECCIFPAWETRPFEPFSPYGPLVGTRIATLFRLQQHLHDGPISTSETDQRGLIIVTTPRALLQRLPPPTILAKHGFLITKGNQLDLTAFRRFLTVCGYRSVNQVNEPGEFAIRGGILDFFPSSHKDPVRIELFGDEVETIRTFDPQNQRSNETIHQVNTLPVREIILNEETISTFRTQYRKHFGGRATTDDLYRVISRGDICQGMEQYLPLFYPDAVTFFDYLPQTQTTFLLESNSNQALEEAFCEIDERFQTLSQDPNRHILPPDQFYLSRESFQETLQNFSFYHITEQPTPQTINLRAHPLPDFLAEDDQHTLMERVTRFMEQLWQEKYRIVVAVRTMGQKERLRELLTDQKVRSEDIESWKDIFQKKPGPIRLTLGDIQEGFIHPDFKVALFTEEGIFGERVHRRRPDRRFIDQLIASFADLKPNDLVVHTDHGIGRFGALHSLDVGQIKNDFLLIEYSEGDKLYVPVENLDRVSKYSGGEGAPLDKLGGKRWEKTKKKARKRILVMAQDLIVLQAKREARQGFQFSSPDPIYQEFCASFPFDETEDQLQAIETVLEEMASPRPMDRLVCGDVGFGKTEVALRATFRAAMDGKQVAILTPTTILAQQHFETFSKRFAVYPIHVGILSRFRTASQQKKDIARVKTGDLDVIIGTHRLLQADIQFKDLGLVVVDEEQRFGVTHKERLKKLRSTVDILTLTATPIPRTLHMAMTGVRDISIIASPPADRLTIRTLVTQYDPQQVREAILREIYRGGQVFFLYNQVSDINKMADKIAELVPEAKIGVAHGQMRDSHLERIMLSFYQQEFNVLVCTTIIENGVDIPTANTIIIHRADKFGLSQLHQLRGRVGRSKLRAYAYLLIPHPQRLSKDAVKRFDALESLGDLGSGFMLATHDLEIRGAGNILGDEQSGQIKEVGYSLYSQMLEEAVLELKKEQSDASQPATAGAVHKTESPEDAPPVIKLHLSTFIPEAYIPDVQQRLNLYKRIAELVTPQEIQDMRIELIDRFGKPPQPVDNLLKLIDIKQLCRRFRIIKLEAGPGGVSLQFHEQPTVDPGSILAMIHNGHGTVRFNQQKRTLAVTQQTWSDPAIRLQEVTHTLHQLKPAPP
ncbi:transcription-repair coupling factor [Magnetococcales bacterium HHB-1]